MDDQLPTGFRFYPTEEELVSFYLHNKLNGTRPEIDGVIPALDIYDFNPSDLPQFGGQYCPPDGEQWFFFIPRQEREARGGRPNRLTAWGYWKATGSPGDVYSSNNRVIGRKRTMVFYVGRAPNGRKTVWKMNEYKAIESDEASSSSASATPQLREELSLCRIYKRSKCLRAFDRRPPSVGAQGDQVAVRHHHRHDASTFNNSAVSEMTDCSMDSSSSGDHTANPSQSNNHTDNAAAGEHFWDWEQLNWSDLLHDD